ALLPLQGTGALPHPLHERRAYARRGAEGIRETLPARPAHTRRPGALRPAAPDCGAGAKRVAPGRQAALRPPQETTALGDPPGPDEHPLYQDSPVRPGEAPDADASLPEVDVHDVVPGGERRHHAQRRPARADPFPDLPRTAALLPRVLQLQDRDV